MFRLAHGLIVLLAASPLLAARLRDGQYKISYSPAPCGIDTKHYLGLSGPTAEATFSPIPESQAQVWSVATHPSDSNMRELQNLQHSGSSLGYPTATRETRVRGVDNSSEDFYHFNIQDTQKEGYYFVYPQDVKDMVVNGDTRIEARNRFAYLRGNSTQFPTPMLPLLFTPVSNVSIEV
ncbi:hypothetical protein B0J17DRAFT_722752 [Rhizoctonia solani]|nr:hypothetical protein B0J17DRAFT_722752 [Rhizoctonia solani]